MIDYILYLVRFLIIKNILKLVNWFIFSYLISIQIKSKQDFEIIICNS